MALTRLLLLAILGSGLSPVAALKLKEHNSELASEFVPGREDHFTVAQLDNATVDEDEDDGESSEEVDDEDDDEESEDQDDAGVLEMLEQDDEDDKNEEGDTSGSLLEAARRRRTDTSARRRRTSMQRPYKESEAKLFLEYARIAFCNQPRIESWKCGEMCDATRVVPGTVRFLSNAAAKVQGYVAQLPSNGGQSKRCVAAFRGSTNINNWGNNLKTNLVNWPKQSKSFTRFRVSCKGCKVHGGFATVYERLRNAMFKAIQDLGCKSIRFTGHSLGAAITTIASLEAHKVPGLRVETTYTFGSPRIGNLAFVQTYIDEAKKHNVEPPMWRVVHYRDPASRVPPSGRQYLHIPTEVYYERNFENGFRVCKSGPSFKENRECAYKRPFALCLNKDHLTYLGKTLGTKDYPDKCEAQIAA